MSHKTIAKIAVIMLVVFGLTILLFPMLFNSENNGSAPIKVSPVTPPASQ